MGPPSSSIVQDQGSLSLGSQTPSLLSRQLSSLFVHFTLCLCFGVLLAYVCAQCACLVSAEARRVPGIVTDRGKPPSGCWESDSGLLQEWPVLLTQSHLRSPQGIAHPLSVTGGGTLRPAVSSAPQGLQCGAPGGKLLAL